MAVILTGWLRWSHEYNGDWKWQRPCGIEQGGAMETKKGWRKSCSIEQDRIIGKFHGGSTVISMEQNRGGAKEIFFLLEYR